MAERFYLQPTPVPDPRYIFGFCCFVNAFLIYTDEVNLVGLRHEGSRVYSLLVAGSSIFCIVPFTFYIMFPIEDIIIAKETRLMMTRWPATEPQSGINGKVEVLKCEGSDGETRRLSKGWATLNYGRAILSFVGVLVAWSVW